jgi:MFS family permease
MPFRAPPASKVTLRPPVSSDAFAALRVPAIRRFVLGRMAWALATQMLAVAVGYDVYERTDSMWALGFIGLVQVIPVIVLALPAGAFVDRHNRRTVSLSATACHAVFALLLSAIALFDLPTWTLYLVLVGIGCATAFGAPATSAFYTQIVPPELFVNANHWRSSSYQLAATGGPALAGLVIALSGGATAVYLLNAVVIAAFFGVVASIPRPPDPISNRGPLGEELRAGVSFVFSSRLLLAAITLDMFAVLLGGATALLPVYAKDILDVGPTGLGWLRAAPALGALSMALISLHLPPWRKAGRALLLTVVGFGGATILFGLATTFWVALVGLFLTGVFDHISVVIRMTLEQLVVPDELRGRVGAVHHVFIGMSNQLGEFESGTAAALFGPIGAVVGGGVGTILVVAIVALKWPELRKLGALESLKPPEPAPPSAVPATPAG